MAKLYFRYGAMGSSKTTNLLMVQYNYKEKGQNAIILKPKIDNRDGDLIVKSRIGLEQSCQYVEDFLKEAKGKWKSEDWEKVNAILIDEAQFITEEEANVFADIVDYHNIPVICYGLRTDFTGHLFEGSKRLLEIADVIEEIPTICWCGRKAHFNARVVNGHITTSGEQVMLGGNECYVSLCRKHFFQRKINKNNLQIRTRKSGK